MTITYREAIRQRGKGIQMAEKHGLKATRMRIYNTYCFNWIFRAALEEAKPEKIVEILTEAKEPLWTEQFILIAGKLLTPELKSRLQAI